MAEWRFLLDENIDPKVATYLNKEELFAVHVRDTLGQSADDEADSELVTITHSMVAEGMVASLSPEWMTPFGQKFKSKPYAVNRYGIYPMVLPQATPPLLVGHIEINHEAREYTVEFYPEDGTVLSDETVNLYHPLPNDTVTLSETVVGPADSPPNNGMSQEIQIAETTPAGDMIEFNHPTAPGSARDRTTKAADRIQLFQPTEAPSRFRQITFHAQSVSNCYCQSCMST